MRCKNYIVRLKKKDLFLSPERLVRVVTDELGINNLK